MDVSFEGPTPVHGFRRHARSSWSRVVSGTVGNGLDFMGLLSEVPPAPSPSHDRLGAVIPIRLMGGSRHRQGERLGEMGKMLCERQNRGAGKGPCTRRKERLLGEEGRPLGQGWPGVMPAKWYAGLPPGAPLQASGHVPARCCHRLRRRDNRTFDNEHHTHYDHEHHTAAAARPTGPSLLAVVPRRS